MRVNPDGRFSDEDRARQRGFTWTRGQRPDGMSTGTLIATPEQRAMIDALLAKYAAPGMCNPTDQTPPPTATHLLRRRSGIDAATPNANTTPWPPSSAPPWATPNSDSNNGLPVTVIATATIQDLHR